MPYAEYAYRSWAGLRSLRCCRHGVIRILHDSQYWCTSARICEDDQVVERISGPTQEASGRLLNRRTGSLFERTATCTRIKTMAADLRSFRIEFQPV